MVTLKLTQSQSRSTAKQPADPFLYGWRYVKRTIPNHSAVWEKVPLTLQDVLHPQEDDFIVTTHEHAQLLHYLAAVLRRQLKNQPGAVVLSDCRIAYPPHTGIDPHGPDIAVIFGVRQEKNWGTFDCEAEGTLPAFVIEVTSPATRQLDLFTKVEEYAQVGIPYYIIVDTYRRQKHELRIIGYQLDEAGEYVFLDPDERGWFWLASAQSWIGIEEDKVYLYDEFGQRLEDYVALSNQVEAIENRAEEAENRAKKAEQQAEQERLVRLDVEKRLREMEEELKRLRG